MMKSVQLLFSFMLLAASQVAAVELQPQTDQQALPADLPVASFLDQFEHLDPQQLLFVRESLLQQYQSQPDDWHRWQAAYALSRTPATPQQLTQSREILAEISAGHDLAPLRDLLDGEIRKSMQVQQTESSQRDLQSQNDQLQSQLSALNRQLDELQQQMDAVKEIEEEMVETQQLADEMPP
jgi:peptidoglycan hydrolase CwlO-like protein